MDRSISPPEPALVVEMQSGLLQTRMSLVPLLSVWLALLGLATGACRSSAVDSDTRTEGVPGSNQTEKTVEIEFLYLDLETCGRCTGTGANLETAIGLLTPVLEQTGVNLVVRKTRVESEERARRLAFMSSPTVRVAGRDVSGEFKESPCESCGELCGEATDCRVWIYRGQEYTAAPVGLIMEAILREIYGDQERAPVVTVALKDAPENLRRFFASKAQKEAKGRSPCCPSGEESPCCPPKEKTPTVEESRSESRGHR